MGTLGEFVSERALPDPFLDLPEVGRLTGEGGAMDLQELGEPFRVVAGEELVDALVGIYAQELPDHLHGDDLRVGELGRRAAPTVAPLASPEQVVQHAEDAHDEGVKIHDGETPFVAR